MTDSKVAHIFAHGKPVRVPKAADLVVSQLRRSIVRGEVKDGQVLPPEASLVDQFGVSRPTLREAYRVLESESLIEIRRGRDGGAIVRPPDGRLAARYVSFVLEYREVPLTDVFDAAADIEAPCIAELARRKSKQIVAELREVLDAEEAATTPEEGLAAQQLFHHRVIELAGNGAIIVFAEVLRYIIDNATSILVARDGSTERETKAAHKGSRTHRRIVELIEAGDAVAAEELWRKHTRETSKHLRQGLGNTTLLDLTD